MLCELKRLFAGRGMWTAMLLAVSAILSGTAWTGIAETSETGNFLLLVQNALCSRSVYFLMPVVAVLPWSDSILSERKGGFLKSILSRCIRRVYVENKILTVALGAFLSWIIAGMAVSFLFFVFFFPQS